MVCATKPTVKIEREYRDVDIEVFDEDYFSDNFLILMNNRITYLFGDVEWVEEEPYVNGIQMSDYVVCELGDTFEDALENNTKKLLEMKNFDFRFVLPEVKIGDVLLHYDDGKIRESRKSEVTITNIVPVDKISDNIRKEWISQKYQIPWVFHLTTDVFIFGKLENGTEVVYARTWQGQFFSFNGYFSDGLLWFFTEPQ